jgi:hypothetical protein
VLGYIGEVALGGDHLKIYPPLALLGFLNEGFKQL